jgi:hypothetical protein
MRLYLNGATPLITTSTSLSPNREHTLSQGSFAPIAEYLRLFRMERFKGMNDMKDSLHHCLKDMVMRFEHFCVPADHDGQRSPLSGRIFARKQVRLRISGHF